MEIKYQDCNKEEFDEFAKEVLGITQDIEFNFPNVKVAHNFLYALDRRMRRSDEKVFYSSKKNEDGVTIRVHFSKTPLKKKQIKDERINWIVRNLKEYGNCVIPNKKIKAVGITQYEMYLSELVEKNVKIRIVKEWVNKTNIYIAEVKNED